MRKLLLALIVAGFAMPIGTNPALAGGASGSTGDGFHCYLFFVGFGGSDGLFAQAMMNDADQDEVKKVRDEFLTKAALDEFALTFSVGNVDRGGTFENICRNQRG